MVAKTYILQNLKKLEGLYNRTSDIKNGLFYSKLAVLELCGWIEESMDDIIRRCAARNLERTQSRTSIEQEIIQRTYGFEYKRHFRRMLMQLIGIISLEKLERKVDGTKFQIMEATLETLKTYRNSEAHTHLKGITRRLNAPSMTISDFSKVYEGLKNIESTLKKMNL